jgi:hypothetical protein
MPVSKDFRVKKGLVVGENIDATAGNLSAVNIDASGTFTAGTFEPVDVTATGSVSSPSISADNIWGNIKDVTYSDLTLSGTTSATSLSAESLSAINIYGNVTDATYSDLTISGTTSADELMLDSGQSVDATSDQWNTGGATMQSSFANIGHGGTHALFSIPIAKYRSGKVIVQAVGVGVGGTNPDVNLAEISELLFIHNGTTASLSQGGISYVGDEPISTYSAAINGSNVEIKATASSPTSGFVHFIGTITQLHTTQV